MNCSNCHGKVEYNMNFCPTCGYKLHFPSRNSQQISSGYSSQNNMGDRYQSSSGDMPTQMIYENQGSQNSGYPSQNRDVYRGGQEGDNYPRQSQRQQYPPPQNYQTEAQTGTYVPLPQEEYVPRNRPVGVGSSSRLPSYQRSSVQKSPLLPEKNPAKYNDYDDDDDYDDYDDEKPKKGKGLLIFLIIAILGVGILLFLQITEKIQLENLPGTIISWFSGDEESSDEPSDISSESSEISVVGEDVFSIDGYTLLSSENYEGPYELAGLKIHLKSSSSHISIDSFPEFEGMTYFMINIALENTSTDTANQLRYAPQDFFIYSSETESFYYPILGGGIENAMVLGQVAGGQTSESALIFSLPKTLSSAFLCYASETNDTDTLAKILLDIKAAEDTSAA